MRPDLTTRQRQIEQLYAQDMLPIQIADQLGITENTVCNLLKCAQPPLRKNKSGTGGAGITNYINTSKMNTEITVEFDLRSAESTLVSYILHRNLLEWLVGDVIDSHSKEFAQEIDYINALIEKISEPIDDILPGRSVMLLMENRGRYPHFKKIKDVG